MEISFANKHKANTFTNNRSKNLELEFFGCGDACRSESMEVLTNVGKVFGWASVPNEGLNTLHPWPSSLSPGPWLWSPVDPRVAWSYTRSHKFVPGSLTLILHVNSFQNTIYGLEEWSSPFASPKYACEYFYTAAGKNGTSDLFHDRWLY